MDTLQAPACQGDGELAPSSSQDIPSCQGCRLRKLRCSRVPCVYELKKNKPGLKLGAVEALNRRMEALEHAVLELSRNQCNGSHAAEAARSPSAPLPQHRVRTTVTASAQHAQPPALASPRRDLDHAVVSDEAEPGIDRTRKRRKLDSCGNIAIDVFCPLEQLNNGVSSLPQPRVMESIITTYFSLIQPWIPILHETRFRAQLHDTKRQHALINILHAMVVATGEK
ncbi:uncharacterized protein B0I36DRAFT_364217 [Microdochium trichocladiopsis]|uniref:Zn(2)-C6 fungal-type domain-containing protein n=1 Tax=Microdochium trichocladiopsis TaxID=1682393 RepID=A0A9P8Y624_9PEZI|nr:uncharacterized protein B0I36DRAFT_364217 [Microdochium trichocladiopsis]KAH7029730.1 hypothetical protein B0I36DRAFT_364217 [Microdochium trichocladiopsis]